MPGAEVQRQMQERCRGSACLEVVLGVLPGADAEVQSCRGGAEQMQRCRGRFKCRVQVHGSAEVCRGAVAECRYNRCVGEGLW